MSRVMIVENETATRKQLEKLLVGKDLEVESVADGRTALEKVKVAKPDLKPDLMLLDIVMPKLSGIAVIEKLRERGEHIPVLMMGMKSLIPKSLEMDAVVDYIEKPVVAKDVLAKVERALAHARTRRMSLEVPLRELHDPESGRIDAKKVAEFLGVPLTQLAETLETNYQTVYKTPHGPGLQNGLRPIKRGIELISRATRNPSDARAWLNNAHPDLGGRTPLEVILSGRPSALVTLLENALSGIPS